MVATPAANLDARSKAHAGTRGAHGRFPYAGTRDPTSDKSKKILEEQPTAKVDTIQNSIAWADAVILATPGASGEEAVKALAASLLPAVKGKVLLDATNPLSGWPGLEIPWGATKSVGELFAEALPDTFVYKAFNTLGASTKRLLLGRSNGARGWRPAPAAVVWWRCSGAEGALCRPSGNG